MNSVLTVVEVARELRCSRAHVYHAINGKVPGVYPLPAISLGRRRLIRRSTLEAWKQANARLTIDIHNERYRIGSRRAPVPRSSECDAPIL